MYTPILREGVPHKHLEASLVYMHFPSFPLENKLFGKQHCNTKTVFCLLRHLRFQNTFFPPIMRILDLRVCRPGREPKTRKPPKVLPGVLPEIGVLSAVLPRVLSKSSLWRTTGRARSRALSGALVGAPGF